MKIGIATFSNTLDNYGQVLQYLATQEFLKKLGHECYMLREKVSTYDKLVCSVKKAIKRVIYFRRKKTEFAVWNKATMHYECMHPRHFESFRQHNFKILLVGAWDYDKYGIDAFAVGSDQTWCSMSKFYFLAFVSPRQTKFAFAPSIGKMRFSDEQVALIGKYISDYKFITCREDSAIEVCKKAGYDGAIKVLDPTFLIGKSEYLSFASEHFVQEEDFIFLYLLGAEISVTVDEIYEFARANQLAIKYVASQGRDDYYPKVWATVPEWLELMSKAKYVMTNSFHGMAFSIIFGKPFLVFPISAGSTGLNERVYNLAQSFSCTDRIFNGSLDRLFGVYNLDRSAIDENISVMTALMSLIVTN